MTMERTIEGSRTWENRAMVEAIVAWITDDLEIEIDSYDDDSIDPSSYLTLCETTDAWKQASEGFWEALRDDPKGLWQRVQHPDCPHSTSVYSARDRWSDARSHEVCWDNARQIARAIHGPAGASALDRREIAALYDEADAVFSSMVERLTVRPSDD